ncbi:MAG: thioredoxin family protein [Peptostreptococcaceae bacterium]
MLKNMTIIELFQVGKSFETAVGEGSKFERATIPKNYLKINLSEEIISQIKNINQEINFLVSGEIWCPDFQLNATALKKMCDLNDNFNMSIISFFRGVKFLAPILDIQVEMFACPTIIVLDKEFNIIGKFEEMPQKILSEQNFEEIEENYLNGEYLLETVNDILKILNSI